jgi:hypothetical protein
LCDHRGHIATAIPKNRAAPFAEILVELDSHWPSSHVDGSLARHLRPKGEASPNILGDELRIVLQDRIGVRPTGVSSPGAWLGFSPLGGRVPSRLEPEGRR